MRKKQMVCSLVSIDFDRHQFGIKKNKLYKTLDYWSRYMFNFNFPEKGLGLVSPRHFMNDFSWMFLIIYSINWPDCLINSISGDTGQYVYYICFLTRLWCLKFAINQIFLIKPFCYMTKIPDKNLNSLRTKRAFEVK